MRILVTGAQGQLARSLAELALSIPVVELIFASRPEFDLSVPGSASRAIDELKPELVINAAAYTAVDWAESERELAFRVNAEAVEELAAAAAGRETAIVQISTDYVFDGLAAEPYREDAAPNPLNVYGRSKLAGEEAVRRANPAHMIVRTSWVYSPFGSNFVKTMLQLAGARDEVRVVSDQFGSPTSALDVAAALFHVCGLWAAGERKGLGETYHLAGTGSCSWAQFAANIFEVSADLDGPSAAVTAIRTEGYPTAARRPLYAVLDSGRFADDFGIRLPSWEAAVRNVVSRLIRRP